MRPVRPVKLAREGPYRHREVAIQGHWADRVSFSH